MNTGGDSYLPLLPPKLPPRKIQRKSHISELTYYCSTKDLPDKSAEMWDFSFTGRVFDIDGKKLMVLEQLTEFLDFELGQRRVLTRVINMENNLQSLLKICYQLDPEDFDLVDSAEAESAEELAEEHYCHEVQLTALLGERGLGPKYYHHETQFQEEWMPFSDGYIDFLVMQIPPGENVDVIQDELTDRQLESIRTQLAHILE